MPYLDSSIALTGRVPPPPRAMPAPAIDMLPTDAPVLPGLPAHVNMVDVEAAGRHVAEASAAVEESRAPLAAAEAHRDRIAGRLGVLDAQRAAIVSRRAGGDEEPDDAARLALIAADREGLASLLVAAEAALVEPRAAAERARTALAEARRAFDAAEDEAVQQALARHADRLGALLLQTVGELDQIRQRRGRGMPAWAPTAELYNVLRKLAIQRRVV